MLLLSILALMLLSVFGEICPQSKLGFCEKYSNNKESATANQLVLFKEDRGTPVGCLTSATGRQLETDSANEVINDDLIMNPRFLEGLTHFVREPTLPRVVHAKGGGAYGHFVVTHDVTDIMNIAMFNETGKKTPTTVRFSPTSVDFGGVDTDRDNRGFAIKFKTPEGIFDLLCVHLPAFSIKDPIKFPSFIHVSKRNPQTFRPDMNMLWDFITLNPETVNFFVRFFSDIGIPSSYTKMPGYPIHTFAFCNNKGERFVGRFRLEPDAGESGLSSAEGMRKAGENPDYLNQELYDMIARGKYPSWTLFVQALSEKEAEEAKINIYDTTLDLDEDIYVPRCIGKLILNKNPENFNRDIEPLAFSPGNLVPGIQGVDSLFKARVLVYLDAQNKRLEANHNKIPANSPCPYAKPLTYYRDGASPLQCNGNNGPNYFPNSFYGPVPVAKPQCPKFDKKIFVDPKAANFEQAAKYFNDLCKEEQGRVVENIVVSLSKITAEFITKRALELLKQVDENLGCRVEAALEAKLSSCSQ